MGTRSNLYKNPSISYKKDLSISNVLQNLQAYNVATGVAVPPPPYEQPPVHHKYNDAARKRRRRCLDKSLIRDDNVKANDGPMSHQDYIDQRRKEASSSEAYQELTTADVFGTSSGTHLVNYESDDESTALETEGKFDHINSGHSSEVDKIKSRFEQRFPASGEPVCVICSKYGEYIYDETDDDICSMECKAELLKNVNRTNIANSAFVSYQSAITSSSGLTCASHVDKFEEDTWNYNRHCWSKTRSSLCTYECWKCKKPGHLAEDCLVVQGGNKLNFISRDLLGLYKRCHQIGKGVSTARCNTCSTTSTLAHCLHCSNVFCDYAGHLNNHIRTHQSHRQYYSFKLNRLVKCSKSTCNVTDIKDLLACHYCLDKAFDKFYDMCTATWKRTGFSIISGSICCEDHFTWHRMNCLAANMEDTAYIIKKDAPKSTSVQLSDYIF